MNFVGWAIIRPFVKQLKDDVKNEFSVELKTIKEKGEILSRKIITPNKYSNFSENDFYLNGSKNILFKIKITETNIYIKGESEKAITILSKGVKKEIDISNEIKGGFEKDFTLYVKKSIEKYERVLEIKKHRI